MEDGKMVLIAFQLLESSFGACIEGSVNQLMMTANKKNYKNAPLVMLLVDEMNPQAKSFAFLLTSKSCGVQLSIQGLFNPIAGNRC
jgi:hypothetical protein